MGHTQVYAVDRRDGGDKCSRNSPTGSGQLLRGQLFHSPTPLASFPTPPAPFPAPLTGQFWSGRQSLPAILLVVRGSRIR